MQKKTFLQIFLFIVVLVIAIVFFKTYFVKKEIKDTSKNIVNKKYDLNNKQSNLIHNIEYISQDDEGNSYVIKSKFGELDDDRPELISMKNVVATINLKNSTPINISADHAIYNNVNYDTNFFENVVITYNEHIITSNNLDLIFEKNLATITNDIVYKNLNTKLQADKVEIDLITKDSKIFMYDKYKKVKIMSIN